MSLIGAEPTIKTLDTKKIFQGWTHFCDEDGNVNTEFPRSQFANVFRENAYTTTVSIIIVYENLSDLEKVIQNGL